MTPRDVTDLSTLTDADLLQLTHDWSAEELETGHCEICGAEYEVSPRLRTRQRTCGSRQCHAEDQRRCQRSHHWKMQPVDGVRQGHLSRSRGD